MINVDKELAITVLVVLTAISMMAFGLKIEHDTFEQELELVRATEATNRNSIDYRILNGTRRAEAVPENVSNPVVNFAIEEVAR